MTVEKQLPYHQRIQTGYQPGLAGLFQAINRRAIASTVQHRGRHIRRQEASRQDQERDRRAVLAVPRTRVDSASPPVPVGGISPRQVTQAVPATTTSIATTTLEQDNLKALIRNQKRAIEVLEVEKASLSASLERLAQVEIRTCLAYQYM